MSLRALPAHTWPKSQAPGVAADRDRLLDAVTSLGCALRNPASKKSLGEIRDRPSDDKVRARSFIMMTTSPNELAARIHDRMPLVLDDAGAREWLGYTPLAVDKLRALCWPFSADKMKDLTLPSPEKKIISTDLKSDGGELTLDLG